jgi:hypothetical protein
MSNFKIVYVKYCDIKKKIIRFQFSVTGGFFICIKKNSDTLYYF